MDSEKSSMYVVIPRITAYKNRYVRTTVYKLKWNIKKMLNSKEGRKGKIVEISRKHKMVDVNPYISVIKFLNGVNIPINRLSEYMKYF